MHGASSPHSEVMVGKIPSILHGICFPVQSQLGLTGAIVHMTVLVLSHTMEIDWLHDGNQLVCLGHMMGIDRVQFHQPDWDGLGPESV